MEFEDCKMKDKKELIASGKFVRFVKKNGWEYFERIDITGIVVILAVTDDNKLILTEQHRPPVDNQVIELPAGLAGDIKGEESESLEVAARRELFEETGYEADSMKYLIEGPPSAGISKEIITFFKASGLKKTGKGGGDDTESIITHEVPLSQVETWLKEKMKAGFLVDPKVYTGMYFATK